MDYNKYAPRPMDVAACLGMSAAITAAVAWLFYRSPIAMALLPAVFAALWAKFREGKVKARKERLLLEFKDAMQAVSAALLAGYAMENAWREAEREMRELHGEESLMCAELSQMNAAVRMNEPLERVLMEFAGRSGCEEIMSFAEVFAFAKRGGGDFARMIQVTVSKLSGRIEVEREIATALSGRKLEGRIMSVMPAAILAYLSFTSGGFLDVLYGNLLGVAVMTVALAAYVFALWLSERILDIEV